MTSALDTCHNGLQHLLIYHISWKPVLGVVRNNISNVCLSESETRSDASISVLKQQPLTPTNCHVKQENSGHVEVESDESCCRQDNELFDQNIGETNGGRSTQTGTEDLVDKKINENLHLSFSF